MPKFQKKPKVFEAHQYDGSADVVGVCCCDAAFGNPHLHTMHEGQTVALEIGDWIVPEPIPGRYYPINNSVMQSDFDCVEP